MMKAPEDSYENRVKQIEDTHKVTFKISNKNGKMIIPDKAHECNGEYTISLTQAINYIENHPDIILEVEINIIIETGIDTILYRITRINNEFIVFKNDIQVEKYNHGFAVWRYIVEDGGLLCL